ncbi:hypothetical protein, partial [Escherichia coli]|uniref:hypothetical protein n=1 Tax=Escherichia coli TaxID=562 RepID=UPI001D0C11C1
MLQMMLFLIHTRHKYHRHKPDKYPINMQQSFNYSIYSSGFAPIFPDTCYHLTHYWLAAVDIPVASDNPVHYADA